MNLEKLTFRQKRLLKSSQRRVLVDSIEIGLASPEQIREWSRRRLPHKILSGEVLSSKTVDYKTLKPIRDGLFCERIFGPTRDFMCSCGKKRTNKDIQYCPDCDVEHTESRVRRYRLGHINLISSVTHVWYLRGRPSYISTLLGRKRRSIEALAYCTTFIPEYLSLKEKPSLSYFQGIENAKASSSFGSKAGFTRGLGDGKLSTPNASSMPAKIPAWNEGIFAGNLLRSALASSMPKQGRGTKIASQKVDLSLPLHPNAPEKKNAEVVRDLIALKVQQTKQTQKYQKILSKGNNKDLSQGKDFILQARLHEKPQQKVCFSKADFTKNKIPKISKIFLRDMRFGKVAIAPVAPSAPSVPWKVSSKTFTRGGFSDFEERGSFFEVTENTPLVKVFPPFKVYTLSLSGKKNSSQIYLRNKILDDLDKNLKKSLLGRSHSRIQSMNPFLELRFQTRSLESSFLPFAIQSSVASAVSSRIPSKLPLHFPCIFDIQGSRLFKVNGISNITNAKDGKPKKLKLEFGLLRKKIKNKERVKSQNVYSQPQTIPISATFACDLDERSKFLNYVTCLPLSQDRQISMYSKMQRKHPLEVVYGLRGAHLLTSEDTVEEILSYTGGEAIREIINSFEMSKLRKFLTFEVESLSIEIENFKEICYNKEELRILGNMMKRRARLWRRLRLARLFSKSCKKPEWMILSALPVLPPDLRPILRLDGDVLVVSDLNQLYQKVLFRNSRFKRLGIVTVESVAYAKGLLQEAVDALLDNGKGGAAPMVAPNDRPLKSLSHILKGKRGRFRQNLLGKRVDYSGRSVIVVGPKLLLHQCGLPREMALELFQPFIIRKLLVQGFARGIGFAKRMIQRVDPIVWEIVRQLMRQHPLLLNRAPTLHRLGIQAFQPLLVSGKAILLHPLVCTAFNADFDGDQMAVHIPLSAQARAESWKLLWSRNNILSPATGQPVLLPSQDMVLGCYYLTQLSPKISVHSGESEFTKETSLAKERSKLFPLLPEALRNGTKSATAFASISPVVPSIPAKVPAKISWNTISEGAPHTIAKPNSGEVSLSQSASQSSFPYITKGAFPKATESAIGAIGKMATKTQHLEKKKKIDIPKYFGSMEEIIRWYDQGFLGIHQLVWLRVKGSFENGNEIENPIEIQLQWSGFWKKLSPLCQFHNGSNGKNLTTLLQTTPGRVLLNNVLKKRKSLKT
jgi:DNA-directed RNA polymerase beta' subunit